MTVRYARGYGWKASSGAAATVHFGESGWKRSATPPRHSHSGAARLRAKPVQVARPLV